MDARENYEYYKRKLSDARYSKQKSIARENGYIDQRKTKESQRSNCREDKRNKEKRLEDIDEIIDILTKEGGWFQTSVPDSVTTAAKALNALSSSFAAAISVTGTAVKADIITAFRVQHVEENDASNSALNGYRSARNQLQQEINKLTRTISALDSAISELSSQIRNCNSEQSNLNRKINQYSYNMEYWRRRM